ncbi:hypothetical protein ZIOFF_000698 [Zingiber officinale]|uniref:3,4-dihydroxy-2-butanone-4-phosphate synthase n=1 Tax=Zingiber officinale TaxID=94328 RepID=A0A8J5I8L6_ZINOF|nr:hypothetical protein ZIOFF_000698 [Zingiber officinale]
MCSRGCEAEVFEFVFQPTSNLTFNGFKKANAPHQKHTIILLKDSPLSLKQLRAFVKGRAIEDLDIKNKEARVMAKKLEEAEATSATEQVCRIVEQDAEEGTTTGVSAKDRTKTVTMLASLDSKPEDLHRPGHIFPLKYREGGVLKRAGYTKASVDLAILAGLSSVGVYDYAKTREKCMLDYRTLGSHYIEGKGANWLNELLLHSHPRRGALFKPTAIILRDLGVRSMKLMTNNPSKYGGLKGYGLSITGRIPLLTPITTENRRYLETKRAKMGHVYGSIFDGGLVENDGANNQQQA